MCELHMRCHRDYRNSVHSRCNIASELQHALPYLLCGVRSQQASARSHAALHTGCSTHGDLALPIMHPAAQPLRHLLIPAPQRSPLRCLELPQSSQKSVNPSELEGVEEDCCCA